MMTTPTDALQKRDEYAQLFDRICMMFGPASPEAKVFAKMRNTLETSTIEGKYTKNCRACRCPICGKTRGDAANEARERYRRERHRAAGMEKSTPIGDRDDNFLDIPDASRYPVLEVALKALKF